MYYINPTYAARLKAQKEFECSDCGNCCTQCAPIDVTMEDLKRIADYFGKSMKVAAKRHCRINPANGLLFIKHDRPCKFYGLKNKKCKIYEARPEICRLHPFLSSEPIESREFMVPLHCEPACKVYEKMKERGEIA
jgi:Fe-S-cluster containining protein